MMHNHITAAQFKDHFDRGQFDYGADVPQVRDKDVESAIDEMSAVIDIQLYPTQKISTQAQAYMTAHFLTLDLGASDTGGQPVFNQSSRSVGSISESLAIPGWMMEGTNAQYAITYYGQKWLMMVKQYTTGTMMIVGGGTQP